MPGYGEDVLKEDEEVSGEDALIINKKRLIREVPYADVCS